MNARYHLRKYLPDALKKNKKAYLKYDKLIIEEEVYEYDSTLEDIVFIYANRKEADVLYIGQLQLLTNRTLRTQGCKA